MQTFASGSLVRLKKPYTYNGVTFGVDILFRVIGPAFVGPEYIIGVVELAHYWPPTIQVGPSALVATSPLEEIARAADDREAPRDH